MPLSESFPWFLLKSMPLLSIISKLLTTIDFLRTSLDLGSNQSVKSTTKNYFVPSFCVLWWSWWRCNTLSCLSSLILHNLIKTWLTYSTKQTIRIIGRKIALRKLILRIVRLWIWLVELIIRIQIYLWILLW